MAVESESLMGLWVRIRMDDRSRMIEGFVKDILPHDQDPPMEKVFRYYGRHAPIVALKPNERDRLVIAHESGYWVQPLSPEKVEKILNGVVEVRVHGGWLQVLGRRDAV